MNDMAVFYPPDPRVHIFSAMLSGGLFALRGACALAGQRWPRVAPVRYASYAIDTTLLTAALMLVTILPAAMFANHWLTVKLCFVARYVALGIATMRARDPGVRVVWLHRGAGRVRAGRRHRAHAPAAGVVRVAGALTEASVAMKERGRRSKWSRLPSLPRRSNRG